MSGPERTLSSVDTERRGRVPLPLLLTPIVVMSVLGMVGDAIGPRLIVDNPLLQVFLNPRNRWLLLASPQVDAWAFFTVGFFRLVLTDPLFYVLGLQYGDAALRWAEKKLGPDGMMVRTVEKWFGKAAPVIVLLAPSGYVCLLAGATGMKPRVFIPLNVAGTVGRLVLFRLAGEAFRDELLDVVGWIGRNQKWLIIASIAIVLLQARRARSTGALESPTEMAEEIEAEEERS
jgi:membrane protein DedA with SNARE-associated domain